MSTNSRLFQPIKVGKMELKHRIGMAPMTRSRASDDHVPTDMMVKYYSQRSSMPGSLIITEGTFISPQHGGHHNVPGIYNEAQVEAWKQVTDAVHAKGSYIVMQLWALGRAADTDMAEREGIIVKSSSALRLDDRTMPLEMTVQDIKDSIQAYASAARNAIRAGFDAVELHGANGYLIDQFTQDTVNQRTDAYGGSIENRSRFVIEAVEAVVAAVGAERTAVRFSPWGTFQGMKMADPVAQFSDVIRKLPKGLAYLHLVEPRISGTEDTMVGKHESNAFAIDLWDGPYLAAGGFTGKHAQEFVDKEWPDKKIVVIFGRHFTSTPDLPFRLKQGLAFEPYDRATFYIPKSPVGYIDKPFSEEFEVLLGLRS
ncbi:FMN-linked oxidoreductase [Thozetella sp. PMI_491]|nr:FMN-linked oxidoreductase [Thozetella sp. PMI_491]